MPRTKLLFQFVSIVLLAFRALGCSLCLDGSAITKPNYVLDLTSPVSLKTCKDLSNALQFISDDSDLCLNARALGGLCGCPTREGACSICADTEHIANPQKLLDGLVDVGINQSSFGLELTCKLVESGLQVYDAGQSECLALPLDDLRKYCGCSTGFWQANLTECTLCPLGETPNQDTADSHFVCLDDLECVACADLRASAVQALRGSDECNKIQQISTACGCPSPANACRLCKNGGDTTDHGKIIITPSGDKRGCEVFEAQLRRIDANSTECTSLDASYSDECKCEEGQRFCTLYAVSPWGRCPFPEQEHQWDRRPWF